MTRKDTTLEALADVRAACQRARALAPAAHPPDLPTKPELLGAPDWHPFEHAAWALGEDVRQALKRAPSLNGTVPYSIQSPTSWTQSIFVEGGSPSPWRSASRALPRSVLDSRPTLATATLPGSVYIAS